MSDLVLDANEVAAFTKKRMAAGRRCGRDAQHGLRQWLLLAHADGLMVGVAPR